MFRDRDGAIYGTPAFHDEPSTGEVLSAVEQMARHPQSDELAELALIGLGVAVGRARQDPGAFYEFVMREETSRVPLQLLPHQRLMFDFILAHPKSLIRGFAGSSKTYVMSALVLFELGLDPTERGVIGSANQKQSKKPMSMLRAMLEDASPPAPSNVKRARVRTTSPMQLVFPHLQKSTRKGDPWTQSQLTIERPAGIRDPSVSAVHVGARLPGSRLSWFDGDDLIDPELVGSEENRDRLFDWLTGVVFSRMDADGGRITITNTPYIPQDLTFQLEEGRGGMHGIPSLTLDAEGDVIIRNTNWDTDLIRPAYTKDPLQERHRLTAHDTPEYARLVGIDTDARTFVDTEDRIPLWPERWGWPQLEAKREGPVLQYLQQMRCIVTDPDKQRIKQDHIEKCKAAARQYGVFDMVARWQGDTAFTGVDPAFGLKPQHDKSCVFTFAILPSGHRRILEIRVDRLATPQLTDLIVDTAVRMQSTVCVEENGAQVTIRDWALQKNAEIIVRSRATTKRNKVDPKFGVEQFLMEIQQGMWLFPCNPRTGQITDPGLQDFVKELFAYRPGQHTGDIIMAGWIARELARSIGVLEAVDENAGSLTSIRIR